VEYVCVCVCVCVYRERERARESNVRNLRGLCVRAKERKGERHMCERERKRERITGEFSGMCERERGRERR